MKYMLLIYFDELALSEAEQEACYMESVLKDEQAVPWLAEMGLPHLWMDIEGKEGGTLFRH
jgi:hypothetical protein